MSKRFIITEDERRSILSQYGLLREADEPQPGDLSKVEPQVTVSAPANVKAFQDWLDTNKPGWTTGKPYKTLDKKLERGYGKIGRAHV